MPFTNGKVLSAWIYESFYASGEEDYESQN